MTDANQLLIKLTNLPINPGVYLFKDKDEKIIYIGKAKNLKNRIKSYFYNQGKHKQFKTEILVKKIVDLEFIITDSELEALVLEANMISKYKPKYNIDLKNGQKYPYIKITSETFPRIYLTRDAIKDGSLYIGPYTNVGPLRKLLEDIKKIFKIRSCNYSLDSNSPSKVCIEYELGYCDGVCNISHNAKDYQSNVKLIVKFLTGKDDQLVKKLKERMQIESGLQNFEKAAILRDQIRSIDNYNNKQKVEDTDLISRDYFGFSISQNIACCIIFKVRNGKLLNRNNFFLKGIYGQDNLQIEADFVQQYYYNSNFDFPNQIIVNNIFTDQDLLERWLCKKSGLNIKFIIPKMGKKRRLLDLCIKNAEVLLEQYKVNKEKKKRLSHSVVALKRDLNLKLLPNLIECFDISHFSGKEMVASMVCFKDGKPYKTRYRHFKIKTVDQIDDFASIREVVKRRYQRLLSKGDNDNRLPDLVIIDGGKGQLSSAASIFKELNINIKLISLAKRLEEVFVVGSSEPIYLPRTSSSLKLLQRLRDEAHRFAITYHRKKRIDNQITSPLLEIPGVGTVIARNLMLKFGSLSEIRKQNLSNLTKVKGVSINLSQKILNFLKID